MADANKPSEKRTSPDDPSVFLDDACNAVANFRKRPLLVLFYPTRSKMTEDDLNDVYSALRAGKVTPEEKLPSLDVLVESYGGDPVAGYRLAQLIRDFAEEVTFLIPAHAYSAATILCFSGNTVRLGHFAGLSPIDLTLVWQTGERPSEEIELASIDSFLQFAVDARQKVEQLLKRMGSDGKTQVDSDLLVSMVKEIGALKVGKYFRERSLTGHYAEELLRKYMFRDHLDGEDRTSRIINNFLIVAPAHEFHLDYHLCAREGLAVQEMGTEESDLTKRVVDVLERLAGKGVICPNMSRIGQIPFVRYYAHTAQPAPVTEEATTAEATPAAEAQSNVEADNEREKSQSQSARA